MTITMKLLKDLQILIASKYFNISDIENLIKAGELPTKHFGGWFDLKVLCAVRKKMIKDNLDHHFKESWQTLNYKKMPKPRKITVRCCERDSPLQKLMTSKFIQIVGENNKVFMCL